MVASATADAVGTIDLFDRAAHYIDGQWLFPAVAGRIDVISPATEELIGRSPNGSSADMDAAVAAARRAFDKGPWPRLRPAERAAHLRRMAAHLRERADQSANLITQEMGAPISCTRLGAAAPPALLEFYANLVAQMSWSESRQGAGGSLVVSQEPTGVVAAIVPWNGPLFLLVAKCAPALAAGCTVVAKPAPETPLDAYLLADAAHAAGLPSGVLNIVAGGREVGEFLVSHRGVDKVSFTGSTAAGRHIAQICGRDLRRVGLELGGKSAAIALQDADPQLLASFAIPKGLAYNSGQACAALTRILVPRHRQREFVDALAEQVARLRTGDPLDPATTVGPLVAKRQQMRVKEYIAEGQREGAKIAAGGTRPPGLKRGWFVAPTLFYDATNQMRISREEIFGPVGVVIPYDGGDEEALDIANDSPYGLAGAVFGEDLDRASRVARRLRAGTVGVNTFRVDLLAPHGGFKASGIGREMGREGLSAYLESKTLIGASDNDGA